MTLCKDPVFAAACRAKPLTEQDASVNRGRRLAEKVFRRHPDEGQTWLSGREWNDLAAFVATLSDWRAA